MKNRFQQILKEHKASDRINNILGGRLRKNNGGRRESVRRRGDKREKAGPGIHLFEMEFCRDSRSAIEQRLLQSHVQRPLTGGSGGDKRPAEGKI